MIKKYSDLLIVLIFSLFIFFLSMKLVPEFSAWDEAYYLGETLFSAEQITSGNISNIFMTEHKGTIFPIIGALFKMTLGKLLPFHFAIPLMCLLALSIFLLKTINLLLPRKTSLILVAISLSFPGLFSQSTLYLRDIPFSFVVIASCFYFINYLQSQKQKNLYFLILFLLLSSLLRPLMFACLFIIPFVYLAITKYQDQKYKKLLLWITPVFIIHILWLVFKIPIQVHYIEMALFSSFADSIGVWGGSIFNIVKKLLWGSFNYFTPIFIFGFWFVFKSRKENIRKFIDSFLFGVFLLFFIIQPSFDQRLFLPVYLLGGIYIIYWLPKNKMEEVVNKFGLYIIPVLLISSVYKTKFHSFGVPFREMHKSYKMDHIIKELDHYTTKTHAIIGVISDDPIYLDFYKNRLNSVLKGKNWTYFYQGPGVLDNSIKVGKLLPEEVLPFFGAEQSIYLIGPFGDSEQKVFDERKIGVPRDKLNDFRPLLESFLDRTTQYEMPGKVYNKNGGKFYVLKYIPKMTGKN